MSLWEAVFCGIIQGLTEFLPVSSSGHLALAHTFFGMTSAETCLSFDILLHLATLAVVLIVYHKDVFELCAAFFTMLRKMIGGHFHISAWNENERMVLLIIFATLPLAGAFFLPASVVMRMSQFCFSAFCSKSKTTSGWLFR